MTSAGKLISDPSAPDRGQAPVTEHARIGLDYVAYELFIFALAVYSLLLLLAYYGLPVSPATRQALFRIDFLLSFLFLYDSFRSFVRAPDRWAYLKWGWLDFLGSVPAVLPFRLARLARLIRAWRLIKTQRVAQVLDEFRKNRASGVFLLVFFLSIMALSAASLFVLEVESRAPGANIRSGEDAFWWAYITITTVGYGDRYPVTLSGRVAAMFLMTVGIGFFGTLTSYLVSRLVLTGTAESAGEAEAQQELATLRNGLEHLESELLEMRVLLGDFVQRHRDQATQECFNEGTSDQSHRRGSSADSTQKPVNS